MMSNNKIATEKGTYSDNQESQTAGPRGPVLLQDYDLLEGLAHLNREKIPERITNAKGSGAYGTFTVTKDISEYTRAKLFARTGNSCKVFTRFSAFLHENGSLASSSDLRGFAVKFYTESGNWDLVGSSAPVSFIKDAKRFPDFIQAFSKSSKTNLYSPSSMWEYCGHSPESLHALLMMLSNRGMPYGYRHMNGFGTHTYSMINAANDRVWVKFHFKTEQGIKNFSSGQNIANTVDFAQKDLLKAIESKNFPKWKVYIQVMDEEQAKEFRWNPFDPTKVWFHSDFPLIEIGEMELNEIPEDYFSHVEQAAFSPSHLIDGISYSPDRVLQGRLFAYRDAQRYRLGRNADQLEVNRCPFDKPSYSQNAGQGSNEYGAGYAPSFDYDSESTRAAYSRRSENDDDHYTQPGLFYTKALQEPERQILISNITASMNAIESPKKHEIINRQLCHFFRANIEMGMRIASGLSIPIDMSMMSHIK